MTRMEVPMQALRKNSREVYTERIIQVHCSWIENIRSWKPFRYILVPMFSILERNGEKRKVKLSLFNHFLINKNIFNIKNVVLFLRTFSTQMRTSEFSLW